MHALSPRIPLLLGGLALCAGTAWAGDGVVDHDEAADLERMRWQDRVFLVVADGGPVRVPFKQILDDPSAFFWKRRVGSAVYVGEQRLLITTRSVVGENPMVELFNDEGAHVVARVVGTDRFLDLALLEAIEDLPRTEDLEPLEDLPAPAVGTPCMVLGNAYGKALSASRGTLGELTLVLSGGVPVHVRRVDVPIYPGDSGCPVLDPTGRFLGIVTAVPGAQPADSDAVLEESGELGTGEAGSRPVALFGLAIPAEDCARAWTELKKYGRVRRGFLGVMLSPTQIDAQGGVRVLQVTPGSPADLVGVEPGDRILEFGQDAVTDPHEFCALVAASPPKSHVDIRLVHGDQERLVTVEMAEAIRPPGIYFGRPDAGRPPVPPGSPPAVTRVDATHN